MVSRRRFLKNCIISAAALSVCAPMSRLSVVGALSSTDIPVLAYHRIGDTIGHLTTRPDKFEEDLTRLQEMGYETISLDTFRKFLVDSNTEMPTKPIMITFDDGYLDNFLNAYPLLRKYGMTASFYIITSLVGEEDRLAVGHIREMAANGMSIGSHTVSHRSLGEMGPEEATNELVLSRAYLEGMLQRSVEFVAYPKGSYNGSTGPLAYGAGYCGGFSIQPGTCTRNTNPFVLRRIPIFSYDRDIQMTMIKRGRV